ncbi:MAG: coiled-coil domain-containing protein [Alphaproteobacteria bacterium]
METNTQMNDWHKAEQIRYIAKGIVEHITHNQNEDAVQDLVDFATVIYDKDMSEYATIDDNKDIISEIKSIEFNLNGKIDKLDLKIDQVEERLNVKIEKLDIKIDQVEERLNVKIEKLDTKVDKLEINLKLGFEAKILESQNTLIKWFISLFLTQLTGMVFLFLKLSGKF